MSPDVCKRCFVAVPEHRMADHLAWHDLLADVVLKRESGKAPEWRSVRPGEVLKHGQSVRFWHPYDEPTHAKWRYGSVDLVELAFGQTYRRKGENVLRVDCGDGSVAFVPGRLIEVQEVPL